MSGSIALSEAKDARPEQMSGDWIEWVIMNIINEPLYPTDEAYGYCRCFKSVFN